MKVANRPRKASKSASKEDFITNIPENVITNILDRLPIQNAVRTGILSRNWRFKWNMLTHLVFDDKFFDYITGPDKILKYVGGYLSRIFLYFKGTITKFVIHIPPQFKALDVEDIKHWVMFLSRKGLKELTIVNYRQTPFKLPTHLFSCLEMKHMKLHNCCLHPPPSFHGFPNLLSLDLISVRFKSLNVGEFITCCPLLEILKLIFSYPISKLKLAEIRKLDNLNFLSLALCDLDDIMITSSSIFQFVSSLSKLQELHLDLISCKFAETVASKRVPTSFPCLTTLTLSNIDFGSSKMLLYVFEMLWGFRDLQTLVIRDINMKTVPPPELVLLELNWNAMGQLQLRSVVFDYFHGSKNEVRLIKNLLAYSPLLKKIVIRFDLSMKFGGKDKFKFARKLLKLYRASPIAEVDLK